MVWITTCAGPAAGGGALAGATNATGAGAGAGAGGGATLWAGGFVEMVTVAADASPLIPATASSVANPAATAILDLRERIIFFPLAFKTPGSVSPLDVGEELGVALPEAC
ncbi:hypothetical protein [Roseibium sp. RKSG952]|uniref:hypothetical protein n=1 Tax=Roseibium sp. RKSG952 TaxID=2529384 RepID=UPI0012BBDE82|nr:hypothetical protein [Roseibium sp. RKSG952]MTH98368.1 hypothetical protein [Roseibium sp. RKSG952]